MPPLYCEVLILYYWVLILYCEVLILYYWVLILSCKVLDFYLWAPAAAAELQWHGLSGARGSSGRSC